MNLELIGGTNAETAEVGALLQRLAHTEAEFLTGNGVSGIPVVSSIAELPAAHPRRHPEDRPVVPGDTGGRDGVPIVRAITTLGRSLGLRVLAEGVEIERQLAAVREVGVDLMQATISGVRCRRPKRQLMWRVTPTL